MRIVVTGMGMVSPVGSGVPAFWSAVCRGVCGIRDITRFDAHLFPFTRAGEITDFSLPPELGLNPAEFDLATQFMLTAAAEALRESGLPATAGPDTGVVLSTNFGGTLGSEKAMAATVGKGDAAAQDYHEALFQTAADHTARLLGLTGPRCVLSLSCASGTAALAYGADLIRAGRAQAVLTGGYDVLSRFAWSGLSVLRTMSKDAVRPFDKNRNGTIFSEGAGALVIEELEHARRRGATILAEVAGYATNNNAFHMTAPAKLGAGTAAVLQAALADAGMSPGEIGHINAHGTGTQPNDVTETQAIKTVFGESARRIPITSIKGTTGHLMGASGSAEAIASILTMRDGVIPPTIHFQTPDPECDLDYVFNEARQMAVDSVLSNSAGIGGCNAAVLFKRWKE